MIRTKYATQQFFIISNQAPNKVWCATNI